MEQAKEKKKPDAHNFTKVHTECNPLFWIFKAYTFISNWVNGWQ